MKLNKLRALLLAGAFLIPTTSYAADISVKDTFDDMINTIWTSATGSGQKEMPAKQATAIYLCQPGIPINPATMDDMLDLSNPTGHPAPLQYFSQWFDSIPDISLLRWQPTTGKVSGAFDAVVNGANSNAAPFTEAEKKQYEQARDILWTKKPSLFPDKPPQVVPSQVYADYLVTQQNYQTTVANYNIAWLAADLKTAAGQSQWLVQGGILKTAMNNAYQNWVASNKTDIEEAISLMGSTLKNGTATEITRVQQDFSQAAQISIVPGGGNWYPVYSFPSQWWRPDAPGWTQMTQSSKQDSSRAEQHTKSFSASASFGGLFSFGGSGGYSSNHESEEHESKNMSLKMDYAAIDVQRSWLSTDWMKADDWYLSSSAEPGTISSGTVAGNNNDMFMPMIPNRFIAVRNVEMTADWSKSTAEKIATQISSGVSFGYGPFTIGGKYQQGDASQAFNSSFDGKTLKIPGVQILGFMGSVPPKSAPKGKPQ